MSAWAYWALVFCALLLLVYLLDRLFTWASRPRHLEDDDPLAQVHRLEHAREALRRQHDRTRWYRDLEEEK